MIFAKCDAAMSKRFALFGLIRWWLCAHACVRACVRAHCALTENDINLEKWTRLYHVHAGTVSCCDCITTNITPVCRVPAHIWRAWWLRWGAAGVHNDYWCWLEMTTCRHSYARAIRVVLLKLACRVAHFAARVAWVCACVRVIEHATGTRTYADQVHRPLPPFALHGNFASLCVACVRSLSDRFALRWTRVRAVQAQVYAVALTCLKGVRVRTPALLENSPVRRVPARKWNGMQ